MLRRVQKRKERRNRIVMGCVLVFLMSFSVLGVIIGNSSEENLEYNDFKFKRVNHYYTTKINKEEVAFNFLPLEVENIPTDLDLKEIVNAPMMYFTFDPEAETRELTYVDVVRNDLSQRIDSLIINGMTQESNVYSLPVISCENATEFIPVIYLNISTNTSIEKNGECIVMNAQGPEFFKLRDLILYTYYGVFNEEE